VSNINLAAHEHLQLIAAAQMHWWWSNSTFFDLLHWKVVSVGELQPKLPSVYLQTLEDSAETLQ